MNAHYSSARPTYTYQPTILESRVLIERLAIQISFFNNELRRGWRDYKNDPADFAARARRSFFHRFKRCVSPANLAAVTSVTLVVIVVLFTERAALRSGHTSNTAEPAEVVLLDISKPNDLADRASIGKDGPGRVGFQNKRGEGSGPTVKLARGGGGGGDHNPLPPQTGKLPPPSSIPAAIPIAPPINPPVLPVAGIDIDPALWKDLKAPVYGDPRSQSAIPSKGPGEGEGIGRRSILATDERG